MWSLLGMTIRCTDGMISCYTVPYYGMIDVNVQFFLPPLTNMSNYLQYYGCSLL